MCNFCLTNAHCAIIMLLFRILVSRRVGQPFLFRTAQMRPKKLRVIRDNSKSPLRSTDVSFFIRRPTDMGARRKIRRAFFL